LIELSYVYGPYISGLIALWALFNFFASYMHPRFLVKRGVTLFILLCIIIGPAIAVNGVKETWRRPRPRDTLAFDGHHAFQKVLVVRDRSFNGKSFPSGHASSGFVLVLLYFLLKKKQPRIRYTALLFALFWGIWLGIVRIMQGGHYASDVLWAFGLIWFVTFGLYYCWYDKYKNQLKEREPFSPSRKRYIFGISFLLISGLLLAFRFLTGSPFRITYPQERLILPISVKRLEVKIRARKGDIAVYRGKPGEILIWTRINGHALTDIQANRKLKVDKEQTVWRIDYQVEPSGYYFEYQSHNNIHVPQGVAIKWDLFTGLGSVFRNDLKADKKRK